MNNWLVPSTRPEDRATRCGEGTHRQLKSIMVCSMIGLIRTTFIFIATGAFFLFSHSNPAENSTDIETVSDSVAISSTTAVAQDIASAAARNTRTDTIDGIIFTVSTDKKLYHTDEPVLVRYTMKNRSMGTVLFDFNTSCQFDLQFVDRQGAVVYSLLSTRACLPDSTRILLPPDAGKTVDFDPVRFDLKKKDSLTVKAQMAGYPLSSIPVRIRYETTASAPAVVTLEGRAGNKPVLEFNHETKTLIIRVDRARRLTISAFIMTGQKANKLTCEKFLAPGTHLINFNNKKLADGVVIFKVEGNGFSESRKINLSR